MMPADAIPLIPVMPPAVSGIFTKLVIQKHLRSFTRRTLHFTDSAANMGSAFDKGYIWRTCFFTVPQQVDLQGSWVPLRIRIFITDRLMMSTLMQPPNLQPWVYTMTLPSIGFLMKVMVL
jgi:hypothetical protein